MITPKQCFDYFGNPDRKFEGQWMRIYRPQVDIKALPKVIYCNEKLQPKLQAALEEIEAAGLGHLIKSWDGCFNVRKMRGSDKYSIHSWGMAIDINAADNALGAKPTMDPRLVEIFKKLGFDWGGDWKRKDGMHFQLIEI